MNAPNTSMPWPWPTNAWNWPKSPIKPVEQQNAVEESDDIDELDTDDL
jgi:hypothetical protein